MLPQVDCANIGCLRPLDFNARFFVGAYNDGYLVIGCQPGMKVVDNMCHPLADPPGSCAIMNVNDPSICMECSSGYYLTASNTCDTCPANCYTCTNNTYSEWCHPLYVKSASGSCTAHSSTATPPRLFVPSLQSSYPSTELASIPVDLTTNNGIYTAQKSLTLSQNSSLFIEVQVEVIGSALEDPILVYHEVVLRVQGLIDTSVSASVPYADPNKVLTLHLQAHRLAAQTITMTVTARTASRVTLWRTAVMSYDAVSPCLLPLESGQCLLCNPLLGVSAVKGVCTVPPDGMTGNGINDAELTEGLVPCVQGVKRCSAPNTGAAIECFSGYTLTADKNCLLCDPQCNQCEGIATNCTACNSTYYLKSTSVSTNTCLPCPPGCQVCQNQSSQCITCQSSLMMLANTSCVGVCPSGQYPNASQCLPCQLPCTECTDQNYCTQCSQGMILNDGICTNSGIIVGILGTIMEETIMEIMEVTNLLVFYLLLKL
jgi:hypothetical protein